MWEEVEGRRGEGRWGRQREEGGRKGREKGKEEREYR